MPLSLPQRCYVFIVPIYVSGYSLSLGTDINLD